VVDAGPSPLAGKRVVITRAALQSSELFDKLKHRGAIPVVLPLISFAPPDDYAPLDTAIRRWKQFDWVIFTSAFAVQAIVVRAAKAGRNLAKGGAPPKIAVVGPATKDKAEKAGFFVEHRAQTHLGVALAEELSDRVRNKYVLLPRSDRANPDLPSALRELRADVTEVIAYKTLRATEADQEAINRVAKGEADAVLFFSPSAVHTFIDLVGRERVKALQGRVAMASIGPVTAAALRDAGIQRIITAPEATPDAVVAALEDCFTKSGRYS
jgi:uroporphyrinogen III methyltransferase / synthase